MKKGSYRSLFPRAEYFYVLTRLIASLVIALWLLAAPKPDHYFAEASWLILLGFMAHLLVFKLLGSRSKISMSSLYNFSFIYDIIMISGLVYCTGGLNSEFYLLYYLVVGFAAYYLDIQGGAIIALLCTTAYFLLSMEQVSSIRDLIEIPIRLSVGWFYVLAVGLFSKHFKHSGDKLLHLLDTLNERTTELERTQIQLETIYETSRSLGEIHDLDEVFVEINNIADNILGYPMCSILLLDKEKNHLELRAKTVGGKKEIYKSPNAISLKGVAGKAIETGKTIRVADLSTMNNYIPALEEARSEMAVPMIARGKIIGVLNAE